jgi:hypothetical protein
MTIKLNHLILALGLLAVGCAGPGWGLMGIGPQGNGSGYAGHPESEQPKLQLDCRAYLKRRALDPCIPIACNDGDTVEACDEKGNPLRYFEGPCGSTPDTGGWKGGEACL